MTQQQPTGDEIAQEIAPNLHGLDFGDFQVDGTRTNIPNRPGVIQVEASHVDDIFPQLTLELTITHIEVSR